MMLRLFLFAAFALALTPLRADLRLPGFFGDHMVFQRDAPIPVWGWAEPGSEIVAQLGPDAAGLVTAKADETGRWQAKLPARAATAEGLEFTVRSGEQSIALKDVLAGNAGSYESARLRVFVRRKPSE